MNVINMDAINVMVKDVANFFDSLLGFDYRVVADFYNKDGYYIGQIDRDYKNARLGMSSELRGVWRNKVLFSSMHTVRDEVRINFIVLKGEEK